MPPEGTHPSGRNRQNFSTARHQVQDTEGKADLNVWASPQTKHAAFIHVFLQQDVDVDVDVTAQKRRSI